MRSAGALFASIGTSVMLVAAVTLSLLSISALFALGGFEGSSDASSADELVLESQKRSGPSFASSASSKPVAVAVVNRPPARSAAATRRSVRRSDTVRSRAASTASTTAAPSQVAALGEGTANQPSETREPSPPRVNNRPSGLGDGVRQVGDGLSATVRQTGTTLADVTAPLPPVSVAVRQVVNIVAAVIQGTTNALGGLLGAQP